MRWERILVSVFLGPLVGGAVVLNGFGLVQAIEAGRSDELLQTLGLTFGTPLITLFGYVYGIAPATVTGIVMAALSPRISGPGRRILIGGMVGAVASLVLTGWLALTGLTPGVGPVLGVALIGIGGACAGLAASAIAELVERRPSPRAAGQG